MLKIILYFSTEQIKHQPDFGLHCDWLQLKTKNFVKKRLGSSIRENQNKNFFYTLGHGIKKNTLDMIKKSKKWFFASVCQPTQLNPFTPRFKPKKTLTPAWRIDPQKKKRPGRDRRTGPLRENKKIRQYFTVNRQACVSPRKPVSARYEALLWVGPLFPP